MKKETKQEKHRKSGIKKIGKALLSISLLVLGCILKKTKE